MSTQYAETISTELNLQSQQVISTIALLDEGGTVPFIARYRKEATGLLDEVAIMQIRDRLEQLRELDKRRETILKSLQKIKKCFQMNCAKKLRRHKALAPWKISIYPIAPSAVTRATIAREKGLAPLADLLFKQDETTDPDTEAAVFIDKEKEVTCVEDALAGARDIIAEWINEDPQARAQVRDLYASHSTLRTRNDGERAGRE